MGAIAAMAVFPKLDEFAALVGTPPADLIPEVASLVMTIAQRAAIAYLALAALDYAWQKHKHEKGLKMDKEELKQEFKQQELPAEVKSHQRRRAMEMSRSANDGCRSHCRRDRYQSLPLRRRPQVRERAALHPSVVAKGVDNLASQDP